MVQKCIGGQGSAPHHAGGAYSLPDLLARLRGVGQRTRREWKGKGREKEGKGAR